MHAPRFYQSQMQNGIFDAWQGGETNVLAVLPTGGGKTKVLSDVILENDKPSVTFAHRQELVGQISTALARNGVRHRVIGPPNVVKHCVNLHIVETGRSFVDPGAWHAVAGVDTLIRRAKEQESWLKQVRLGVIDEAHHVLKGNKWGQAFEMLPNAFGLGVTASPCRADGRGLGAAWDGIFNVMIEGPSMRQLINMGYLTDYQIFAPPSDYKRPEIVGSSGDFTPDSMRKASKESKIVGDIVAHYKRLAMGKLGVTFVTDLETAEEVAREFNEAGIPALVVSSKSTQEERVGAIAKFKRREVLQLVNVDLFGEGFDLPAIEVVSFARPTESLGLFIQQFGRVLRLFIGAELMAQWEGLSIEQRQWYINSSSKPVGIVIDHVGNISRHLLPDTYRKWTLKRRDRRSSSGQSGGVPMWACFECSRSWEKIYNSCLQCGAPMPEPASRSSPEFVDGDLIELSAEILEHLRGERDRVDLTAGEIQAEAAAKYMPHVGQLTAVKKHREWQLVQAGLRDSLAWWAGYQRHLGRPDSESYRRFYFNFGIDVLSAQSLKTKEAVDLKQKIDEHLTIVQRA